MKYGSENCVACEYCIFSALCKDYLFEGKVDFFIESLERKVPYRSGALLFDIGQRVETLIALRRGMVGIYDANNTLIHLLSPGLLVSGEDFCGGYYRVRAVALTDVETCILDYSRMYGLSQITSGTFTHTLNLVSSACRENQRMMQVLNQSDARQKVLAFLTLMRQRNLENGFAPDIIDIPVKHKELASMLGLAAVTLRRILAELSQQGIIDARLRQVVIKDCQRLVLPA